MASTWDIAYRPLRQPTPLLTTIAAWRTGDSDPVLHRVLARVRRRTDVRVSSETVTGAVPPG